MVRTYEAMNIVDSGGDPHNSIPHAGYRDSVKRFELDDSEQHDVGAGSCVTGVLQAGSVG